MSNHDLLYAWWWNNDGPRTAEPMSIQQIENNLIPARNNLVVRGQDGGLLVHGWNYAVLQFLLQYCDLPDNVRNIFQGKGNYGVWKKHLDVQAGVWPKENGLGAGPVLPPGNGQEGKNVEGGNNQIYSRGFIMCDKWQECNTLAMQGNFTWRLNNGCIEIHSDGGNPAYAEEELKAIVDYIYSKNDGVQLGAAATGNVPENSIGAFMTKRNVPGFQKPHCSYLAAILVSEGLIDFEYLGKGPGRGIWLYPSSNEGVGDGGLLNDLPSISLETDLNDLTDIFKTIGTNLVELSKQISNATILESKTWNIEFSSIDNDTTDGVFNEIRQWESERERCLYIYLIKANDRANVDNIYENYLTSKGLNIGELAYARVNKEHRGESTLYVGSSKSMALRLKGHLGFGYKKTFSLQMSSWAENLSGGVIIDIIRFRPDTSQAVVQTIEDGLWGVFKPMFGRQGQK